MAAAIIFHRHGLEIAATRSVRNWAEKRETKAEDAIMRASGRVLRDAASGNFASLFVLGAETPAAAKRLARKATLELAFRKAKNAAKPDTRP